MPVGVEKGSIMGPDGLGPLIEQLIRYDIGPKPTLLLPHTIIGPVNEKGLQSLSS